MFGRATIMLGIGHISSLKCSSANSVVHVFRRNRLYKCIIASTSITEQRLFHVNY